MRRLNVVHQWNTLYNEYPRQFWVLTLAGFIDRLGGTMLYPFFTIYIADKYDVGLTTIAYAFVLMGGLGFVANIMGGNVSDRIGRKPVVIAGLLVSAVASLGIGLSPTLLVLIGFAALSGFFNSFGHPASAAMMGDLLPEEKRTGGFAIMRIVMNMAFVVGPLVGGIIATQSFFALFAIDALTSGIMVAILVTSLRETYIPKPKADDAPNEFGIIGTLKSYSVVFSNRVLLIFITLATLTGLVYSQMYQTLPYFMYEIENMPASYYSYILSINAVLVVGTQYWITKRVKRLTPLATMSLASIFLGVGFAMYGIFDGLALFGVAMVIITVGEMIFFPTSQAFVTNLAPDDMRGRYMAAFEFSHVIANMVGMLSAGVFMDSANPDVFWLLCGAVSAFATVAYWQMRHLTKDAPPVVATAPLAAEAVAVGD